MPDPGELVRKLSEDQPPQQSPTASAESPARPIASPPAVEQTTVQQAAVEQAAPYPADFNAFVAFVEDSGGHRLAHHLTDDVGVIRYAPPDLELKAERPHLAAPPRSLTTALKTRTTATR